jgi:hypothetical protein
MLARLDGYFARCQSIYRLSSKRDMAMGDMMPSRFKRDRYLSPLRHDFSVHPQVVSVRITVLADARLPPSG